MSDSSVSKERRREMLKEIKKQQLLGAMAMMEDMMTTVFTKLVSIFDQTFELDDDDVEDSDEEEGAKGGRRKKSKSRSEK